MSRSQGNDYLCLSFADRRTAHPRDQHLHVLVLRFLHHLWVFLHPQLIHRCHHRQLQRTKEKDKCQFWDNFQPHLLSFAAVALLYSSFFIWCLLGCTRQHSERDTHLKSEGAFCPSENGLCQYSLELASDLSYSPPESSLFFGKVNRKWGKTTHIIW